VNPSVIYKNSQNDFRIRLAHPDLGPEELAAVGEVLASGVLTNGPRTRRFEDAFALRHEVPFGVAFANGTVALSAIYLALGIGPGDEVVVPSLTFVSSATSILHVGATPVFADIDPETFNLDPRDVAKRITKRTKAILVVHYGGQPADMDHLRQVAEEANVILLEDAAQAHGATYRGRPVGGLGTAAMFSFTPTKNITTGEGGVVTTHDESLATNLRLLRNHGQTDVYHHAVLGFNWRLTEMQAAIGEVQLRKLDRIIGRKRANAQRMSELLADVPDVRPPIQLSDRGHVFMLYTIYVRDRDHMLAELHAAGIEARVYFPPVHTQPIFASFKPDLPITDEVSRHIVSLPFHSLLTSDDLNEIASAVAAAAHWVRTRSTNSSPGIF
jgi:perosamine synthetase